MRPGVTGRFKPSSEAEKRQKDDVALADQREQLLATAAEAESRFRQAQAGHAPYDDVRRAALDLDAALTAAVHAAYAAQRVEIGARGYDDRIFRRKAMAKSRVRALTSEAERLLTLRETHRLNGIPPELFEPSSLAAQISKP
jgi:hypothetical protein